MRRRGTKAGEIHSEQEGESDCDHWHIKLALSTDEDRAWLSIIKYNMFHQVRNAYYEPQYPYTQLLNGEQLQTCRTK